VQTITIEAETAESGHSLHEALSDFSPEWEMDGDGQCLVTVRFMSDRQAVEVFETIQRHFGERGDPPVISVTVSMDIDGQAAGYERLRAVADLK
jgi:hypothetical protein